MGRNRTRVSILQFIKHTIFSKAPLEELQNLKIILLVFNQVSGLKMLEKNSLLDINTNQKIILFGLTLRWEPQPIGFWDLMVEKLSREVRLLEKSFSIVSGGGLEGCVS